MQQEIVLYFDAESHSRVLQVGEPEEIADDGNGKPGPQIGKCQIFGDLIDGNNNPGQEKHLTIAGVHQRGCIHELAVILIRFREFAGDADPGGRHNLQPVAVDFLTAHPADAIFVVVKPLQGLFDLLEVFFFP